MLKLGSTIRNRNVCLTSRGSGSQCVDERIQSHVQSDHLPLKETVVDAENMYYEVSAMDAVDTPDVLRRKLHQALDYVSSFP